MANLRKLNKAISYTNNKDYESAEKIYAELLREFPNDITVMSFWGLFNIKRGQFLKSEKILESTYSKKKSPAVIAGLAFTKYVLKKYDEAIIFYEELFRYDKNSERIYQKIIDCFMRLKMYNFSIAYCQKYLLTHPENLDALILITKNYINIEDYVLAEKYCNQSLERYPTSSYCWANAGYIQEFHYKDVEMAQICYEKAKEEHGEV